MFVDLFPDLDVYSYELRNQIIIPIEDQPGFTVLGLVGSSDPLEFITLETQRIPFKSLNAEHDWDDVFRSWPTQISGWDTWYKRVVASKRVEWDTKDIS